jgi:phage terminase large subunit GpA-like protein
LKPDDEKRLNNAIAKAVAGMKPPESLTVSQWADRKRRLSQECSAEPGPWRTSRTPYLREIMDAFSDTKVRRIVFVSSSQIGKSELENNIIGYIIDEDPGSILFIHPTSVDAKEYSKLRIAPMIRDCKTLRSKVAPSKSRDSANTILQKSYPGGLLTMCGSTEAHSLASKPIRYVIGDERDRWAKSAGNEGDPWSLAMARQITFYNAKAVEVSTPTVKGASAIEASFLEGTMERWNVQCPHCHDYNDIKFSDIRYEYDTETIHGKKHYAVTEIWYNCPACACVSAEHEIKKQHAKWVPENPGAIKRGVRSFWLNSFVSPWAAWESTVLEYLYAIGSSEKLQVVYNTRFGQLWEHRGDLEDEESLMGRREEYTAELPDGVLVLTAGVDTQDDRLEYEVVGHGHFGETWGIEKKIIMGRPDEPDVWAKLDDVLERLYRFENGVGLRVSITFVDEGGHFTQDVRLQCRARLGKKVFAVKGRGGPNVPYTSPPKKVKIVVKKTQIGTCWQYEIGVDAGKQIIMDNLKVQTAGSRYCHFPKNDDYGAKYFAGLLSETLVYKQGRKQPWVWEIIPGHERNEPLDCRNYANAAFKALPVDLDAVDRRLKNTPRRVRDAAPCDVPQSRRGGDAPPARDSQGQPRTNTVRPRDGGTAAGRKRKTAVDRHYEEW